MSTENQKFVEAEHRCAWDRKADGDYREDYELEACEACEADDGEEIDCWNCEDKGFFVTVGDIQMPCPECKAGDMFFAHDREKDIAEMVHVDDGLGEKAEEELEAWERGRD